MKIAKFAIVIPQLVPKMPKLALLSDPLEARKAKDSVFKIYFLLDFFKKISQIMEIG